MQKPTSALKPQHHPLIEAQMKRVERMAYGMARKLPACVDHADLVQDGLLGLSEAILRWTKHTHGDHYDNYMAVRAQGAMLDGLRHMDHGSRRVRKEMRRIEAAIQQLTHTLGRPPREREVATALDMPLRAYQALLQDAHGYALISLEDVVGDNTESYLKQCLADHEDPLAVLERSALRHAVAQAIQCLPQAKKTLLTLYYERGLKMHEIGSVLQVTEARVSQLHTETIAFLRAAIQHDNVAVLLKPRKKPRSAPARIATEETH